MEPTVVVNAKKSTLSEADALALAAGVDHIYSAKGKRVVHLDLRKSKPGTAELKALLLGPSGNLRAPALRKGRTLIIGFEEATYRELL